MQKVGLIINFDIPYDVDMYIHRIGRSGRYGRKGIAINLLSENDHKLMDNIFVVALSCEEFLFLFL